MNYLNWITLGTLSFVAFACSGETEPADEATGGSTGESRGEPAAIEGLPAACNDVLTARESFPRCDGDVCSQIQTQPERIVEWVIVIDPFPEGPNGEEYERTDEEMALARDCVATAIEYEIAERPDLGDVNASIGDDILRLSAPYEVVKRAIHSDAVSDVELHCAGECSECDGLDEEACRADAFCGALEAKRLDAERGCEVWEFAGCLAGGRTCGDAMTAATDNDGDCWLFSNTCLPTGFSSASDSACSYDSFESLESCAE